MGQESTGYIQWTQRDEFLTKKCQREAEGLKRSENMKILSRVNE